MNPSDPKDPLSSALHGWQLAPSRNPQFRPEVWRRIGTSATVATWPGYMKLHAKAVGGVLALAVVVGALAGREQARTRVALESGRMATAYVQGLDARNMRMP